MHAPHQAPSSADVAGEAGGLLAGLGILTMALFPIALPGLLLFVVAPLALIAVVGLLLAIPLVMPLWLARLVLRGRATTRAPAQSPRALARHRAQSFRSSANLCR
jgi:hypothetical protein